MALDRSLFVPLKTVTESANRSLTNGLSDALQTQMNCLTAEMFRGDCAGCARTMV